MAAEAPASPSGGGGSHESGEQSPRSGVREQDRFLPIANISRIMKKALPANGKIAKDTKETVQECVSEFISFITGEASDKCQREKRKTINGDDRLWAMTTLGFEDYVEPLKVYLQKFRETEGEKGMISSSSSSQSQHKDGGGGGNSGSTVGIGNNGGGMYGGDGGGRMMMMSQPATYGSPPTWASYRHQMPMDGKASLGSGGGCGNSSSSAGFGRQGRV